MNFCIWNYFFRALIMYFLQSNWSALKYLSELKITSFWADKGQSSPVGLVCVHVRLTWSVASYQASVMCSSFMPTTFITSFASQCMNHHYYCLTGKIEITISIALPVRWPELLLSMCFWNRLLLRLDSNRVSLSFSLSSAWSSLKWVNLSWVRTRATC